MILGIVLVVLSWFVEFIYVDLFFNSIGASRIFVPIASLLEKAGLMCLFSAIAYLIGSITVDLILKDNRLGNAFLVVTGVIIGLSIPKLVFFISELRLYNWLPDYSPVGEQNIGAYIITISFLVIMFRMLIELFDISQKSALYSTVIIVVSMIVGIGIQWFEVGIFPDIFMPLFFGFDSWRL